MEAQELANEHIFYIDHKQQLETTRQQSQQLGRQIDVLKTTLSAITDFAYIFDLEGRFIFANQPLDNLKGIGPKWNCWLCEQINGEKWRSDGLCSGWVS